MRPKKVILCVSDSEQWLSVTKFLLETHGYKVRTAQGAPEAIGIFAATAIDLVVTDLELKLQEMNGAQLIERLKQINPYAPMILLHTLDNPETLGVFDAMLAKKSISNFELLERIRVMSARKRGPRKGSQCAPRQEEASV